MNLHRTSGSPDWEHVTPSRRTKIQKLAAATRGIVTPANCISVIGLFIVLYGLSALISHDYWLGLALLAFGRFLDIVDGFLAEATKTKSPLGEIVDSVIDKIVTFLSLFVCIVTGIANAWVIAALALPQILIPLVIVYKRSKKIAIHPTLHGKLSMGLAWLGLIGLILLSALDNATLVAVLVYSAIGGSLVLGTYALWQYASGRDQD